MTYNGDLANIQGGIDLLVLDGWGDRYLPILKLLESRLTDGAPVYADNASFRGMKPYLSYVMESPDKLTLR